MGTSSPQVEASAKGGTNRSECGQRVVLPFPIEKLPNVMLVSENNYEVNAGGIRRLPAR